MTDMAILTRARSAEVEAQVVEVEHLVSESSRGVYDGLRAACRPRATVQSRPPARERGDPAPTVDNSKISMVSFSTSPYHMLMVGW